MSKDIRICLPESGLVCEVGQRLSSCPRSSSVPDIEIDSDMSYIFEAKGPGLMVLLKTNTLDIIVYSEGRRDRTLTGRALLGRKIWGSSARAY